jgi:superfamily I DNA/RNA helicase
VFRVYLALSNDADQVGEYDLILIDEFQDFNRLESSFIDLLASASPIVIAGDDDQALYSQLRSSNPDFIRALRSGGEFEVFELPFCMRCPAAIVAAVNAVIAHAQGQGCLKTRINKPFRHFTPVKGGDSKKYPYIQSVQCSVQSLKANYFGKYIARAIKVIPREEINESHDKLFPTVLIIGSIQYLRQVEQHLTAAGFAVQKREEAAVDLKREDGLSLLKEDPESNLGWRIMLETDRPVCASAAIRTSVESGRNLHELIPTDFKERILQEAEGLELAPVEQAEPELPPENKDVPIIKLVSFEGSKGLSAQHVFVVGVHEGELPHDVKQIKDLEVCKFLVALTRTRKQCHVMTTSRFSGVSRRPSLFVRWLPNLVTRLLRVNKENVASL